MLYLAIENKIYVTVTLGWHDSRSSMYHHKHVNTSAGLETIIAYLIVMEKRQLLYSTVKRPLSKRPKIVFKTNYRLMQVKSIAKCSKGSILQYFRPSLSYQLSLRSLFCLFLSGRFTPVLLYIYANIKG